MAKSKKKRPFHEVYPDIVASFSFHPKHPDITVISFRKVVGAYVDYKGFEVTQVDVIAEYMMLNEDFESLGIHSRNDVFHDLFEMRNE